MERGGIHWSWYAGQPTYFGYFRRGGDGKDVKWIKGPERSATHMMGGFDDGKRLYVDVEMSLSNPFPFMPMRDGSRWDPVRGASHITRLSVDVSQKNPDRLPDRDAVSRITSARCRGRTIATTPCPIATASCPAPDPNPADPAKRPASCYARFDLQNRSSKLYRAPEGAQLAEACFAPKSKNAPEGVGYLMGVASYAAQNGRCDLVILDAERVDEGPIATVKLPTRIVGQIHGWWVPGDDDPEEGLISR